MYIFFQNIMGPSTLTKCGWMYLDSIISLVVTFAGSPTHDPLPLLTPPPPVHPRSLPLWKQSSGLVRGNPWSPSWGWTHRIGPFRHNSLPAVWNHCDPPSRVTQCLTSRTSQKAMPGNEWGGLQTKEISHFSIDGVPDRSTVGTH